jgi:hypothetical protein
MKAFNNSVKNSFFEDGSDEFNVYEKIDAHFKENVSFLNPDYSLNDLVDEIKVLDTYYFSSIKNMAWF